GGGRPDLAAGGDRVRRPPRLRLLRPALARRQPAGGGALDLRPLRLRLRLHALAEALDAAEHRHRRRRRCGPATGRLGGGHGRPQWHGALPLRDRLLLDAAPLLGALAADGGRVRQSRYPDAAGRPRRGGDAAPDPPLHRPALRRHPTALLRGRVRGRVPGRLDGPRRRFHLLRRASAAQRRPALGAAHLPLLARLPGAALRLDAARPRLVEIRPWTARAQERASRLASSPAESRPAYSPSASS